MVFNMREKHLDFEMDYKNLHLGVCGGHRNTNL